MSRYLNQLLIKKTDQGKRYYGTVIPRDVRMDEYPVEYTTRMGDRWDTLAYRYYGSAKLWYRLAAANNGANGSIFIKPGTVIKIPTR
jgi:nucleoid-associated protein YgaU